ncbi:hypothetical protein V9T40_012786 [Parthenolecanium corni]|uniref:phosphoinositide 5-phosphatase n=1 Tax=Parthenolecanium corni TaxID=536013 RepID=A0AAN9T8D6_9HEMI
MTSFGKVFRVLEKNVPPQPYSIILEHRHQENALLFESNAIAVLSSQEFDSVKRQYTKIQDAYGCSGILQFSLGETTVLFLVTITGCVSVGKINESEIFRITQTSFISLRNYPQDEDLISDIKRLLNSGTFYFSRNNSFDLTLCAQRQKKGAITDNRFFWNRMLHIYFIRFEVDTNVWLLKMMCGSVEIRTVYIRHKQARAVIISRLSCERAGTRFNVRGCNDDGYVANFVETEQAIYLDDRITSYLQTRGSVPLFWEQPGVQVGSHKVKMSRSAEASASAYNKHFATLLKRYGRQVIVNLLNSNMSAGKESEAALSHTFLQHHSTSAYRDIPHIVFDYHLECRSGNVKNLAKLKENVDAYLKDFGYFYAVGQQTLSEQKGVFRVNCLDCLDRTNCVQTFFGLEILLGQVNALCESESQQQMWSRFEEVFRQMWVNNGNEVSKIYAGTGAIQGGSKLMDGARSAARTIQNNLLDNSKQEAIDVFLLGNTLNSELADRARMFLSADTLHASTSILREMCTRVQEYTYTEKVRVAVGTYNVNGGKHFRSVVYKDVSLSDWLLDTMLQSKKSLIDASGMEDDDLPVDVFAVGFQEIVDLNAGNIMAASSENANLWAEELQKVLSRDHPYVLLTYTQLVGVCLYIFVRTDLVPHIRDLAIDSVKTGLGGATGNKGAVAIRFVLHASSLCFVCAHFAAGQSQVNERNADYAEITKKVAFPMGRTLATHDYIFWCGDFNYRIDMDKDAMKELIRSNALDEVLQHDQLSNQRREGKVFEGFSEGDITFPPTYKYDLFSEDYDTSEKCRAPAWTDRVLWRRRKLFPDEDLSEDWDPGKLVHYGRAELKQSDHRPVIALLEIEIRQVEPQKRDQVFKNVLHCVGPLDGTVVLKTLNSVDIASVFDDAFMAELLQTLSTFGEVILVRFVENVMWVTFKEGVSALNAAAQSTLQIGSYTLEVVLKSPNWIEQTLREIDICNDNTVPLYDGCDSSNDDSQELRKAGDVVKTAPSRPPAPVSKPKAGVFSIPTNLHQPLQPALVGMEKCAISEPKMPMRPAPEPPGQSSSQPPPVPQRVPPPPPSNGAPPPVPARMGAPPVPPR